MCKKRVPVNVLDDLILAKSIRECKGIRWKKDTRCEKSYPSQFYFLKNKSKKIKFDSDFAEIVAH